MSEFSFRLAHQLESSFNSIGCSMMSVATAAKLLAYVYYYGYETCIYNERLNVAIAIAQQKMNIKDGATPDVKNVRIIKALVHEIERMGEDTPFVQQIYLKYNIK
jgi:hypothetical protein